MKKKMKKTINKTKNAKEFAKKQWKHSLYASSKWNLLRNKLKLLRNDLKLLRNKSELLRNKFQIGHCQIEIWTWGMGKRMRAKNEINDEEAFS